MPQFIARQIEKAAMVSIKTGQEKYKAYFVDTSLYKNFQDQVNAILEADGYSDIIIDALV